MGKTDSYNLDTIKSQMRRGTLEMVVLLIISGGDVYAADILKELKTQDMIVVEGTLYPLLSRMRRAGIVQYEWRESETGPPRKYYRLSDLGKKILQELKTSWNQTKKTITQLAKKYEKSR
jgi:PadR family transcriptional regulator PadR